MKSITNSNPCIRCGKQRTISRTYQEKINNSIVTYTDTVCPDPECQKALELQFKNEKLQRDKIASQKANDLKIRLEERKIEKQTLLS